MPDSLYITPIHKPVPWFFIVNTFGIGAPFGAVVAPPLEGTLHRAPAVTHGPYSLHTRQRHTLPIPHGVLQHRTQYFHLQMLFFTPTKHRLRHLCGQRIGMINNVFFKLFIIDTNAPPPILFLVWNQ